MAGSSYMVLICIKLAIVINLSPSPLFYIDISLPRNWQDRVIGHAFILAQVDIRSILKVPCFTKFTLSSSCVNKNNGGVRSVCPKCTQ